jgi:hypothetical protein
MRVWNLNEPDALNDVVVEELPPSKRTPTRTAGFQSFKAVVGVASVMFTISISTLVVNHGSVRLPSWEAAVIKSVPDLKAPLEEVFSNRFDPEWTLQLENSILSEIVEKRIAGGPTPDRIAAFISSNLQEDVTLEGPRLSSQTVAKILRK